MKEFRRHFLYPTLVCGLLVGLISPKVSAQSGGFVAGQLGQRGLSMGMATPSLVHDASSAYLNPGAMSMLRRRFMTQFGSHIVRHTTTFLASPPVIYQADMDTAISSPVYLHAFYRGKSQDKWNRWSLGLSVVSPYGLISRWPSDWRGRFISQEFSVSSLFVQPTVGIQLNEKMGIGIGLSIGVVSLLSRRAIPIDGPNESTSSVIFGGTGSGGGLNLGFFWQPQDGLAIGINAKTPIGMQVTDGDVTFSVPESFETDYPNQTFTTQFTLPGELHLGTSIWPQENVELAFAIKYRVWEAFDSLIFTLAEPVPNFPSFPERNYQNTTSFHIGAAYTLNERFEFRGGVYYDDSPVQAEYLSPEFPDGDRIGFTLGLDARLARSLRLSISYQYEYNPERTGQLASANFGGTYASTNLSLGAGLTYAF